MKCKRSQAVEVSRGLTHIQQQVRSLKETTRFLKEKYTQLDDEVNELKRKVRT